MRILFYIILASAFIIGLIFELDHGLARGKLTVPETPQFNEIVKKPVH